MQAWVNKLHKEYDLAPKTVRSAYQNLDAALKQAVLLKMIPYNPCVGVLLEVSVGLRRGELLALRWENGVTSVREARVIGDASLTMNVYAHRTQSMDQNAANKIDDVIF